jgi:hypothetical protein
VWVGTLCAIKDNETLTANLKQSAFIGRIIQLAQRPRNQRRAR